MRPFRCKKRRHVKGPRALSPACPHCGSTNTARVVGWNYPVSRPKTIEVYKGQRFTTYRCRECDRDFYA